ncbi:MAG TPA: hypothetical protein VHL58_00420 [Thermoanaerobaculia bacterium]|nr:hypothetical protein [Thermoanaerobaculia bacterium]
MSALLVLPSLAQAGVVEVSLKVPVRARLSINGGEKVAIAPFVIQTSAADVKGDRAAKVDVQGEFRRYIRKQLSKSTKLTIVDSPSSKLPSSDIKTLIANRDFWRDIGTRTGADYVVSGVINFDVQDKAGYKTEEYLSPVDGRTYYRQVLVESTGFVFDIIIVVFNGDTGEKLIEENFRDFKEFDQRNYDEILGLFENLRALEKQLLGIFVPQETSTTRYLFTE